MSIIRIGFTHGGGNEALAGLRRQVRQALRREGEFAGRTDTQVRAAMRRLRGEIAAIAPRGAEARQIRMAGARGGRGRR